ncbi:acyl-CoA dehydrogenase family protein [Actinoplanes philippinensis]|uniref:acyl-CoA dehydrogenase family protein n=1 Tax=Actinoplanes philippinensis TaxID=35752 RepID=UPI0033FF8892
MTNQPAIQRPSHRLVADLEHVLGDPLHGDGPFSFARIVEHEEREQLPPGAVDLVRAWGFWDFLVPEHDGGRMRNLETAFLLTRTLARRNLTVAIMFGSTVLGALPVWLYGDEPQRKQVAAGLLDGGLACFGVSEREHGSDLGANGTTAVVTAEGYRLSGEKWPVGNATRGRFVTVLATLDGGGPSLFLLDKAAADPATMDNSPFVATVGLRGHDLSGITLNGTTVPSGALLGRRGRGLIQVLKTLQITRVAIGALSIGTMDSVLRIGLEYAYRRHLYAAEIYRLPAIRDLLVGAHLDLLIAECTALPVARALSVAPSRLSLWSSVVKYLVPLIGEEVVAHVGRVLAARAYMRDDPGTSAFQKLQRDHAIASVFEGTTHVNLLHIATQLPPVASAEDDGDGAAEALLATLFGFSREVPAWTPSGRDLQLTNASQDEITRGWPAAVRRLRAAAASLPEKVRADLIAVVTALDERRTALYAAITRDGIDPASVYGMRQAAEHCVHHAAASCVYTWLYHQPAPAERLVLLLQRLRQRLDRDVMLSEEYFVVVEADIERARAAGATFSVLG